MDKSVKNVVETSHVEVKPIKRSEVCSLKNAISATIDGNLVCLAHIGKMKHQDALQACKKFNATLPLPRNLNEQNHLTDTFKRLGIDKKIEDISTKIVLGIRRLSNKGRVSYFLLLVQVLF